jgi:myxalamid-type polyketide synthase MxaB
MAIMAFGSIGSFVAVDQRFATRTPEGFDPVAATTIPGAFLTAWYGLNELARIGPGDRVLVHAAAGGVGQAAVQLAQHAGAEVFATASPGKWPALRAMGVQHVFNSRTLDFAREIAEVTEGRGVTVVLNSLNGDFVEKSMDVLAPGGRFVELGKLGVWTAAEAAERRPDVAFLPFDLGEDVALPAPDTITRMLEDLKPLFEIGALKPLPRRTFPITRSVNAFRHMAQAKHVGKVVITLPAGGLETAAAGPALSDTGAYLITGGLGALGLEVARHLAGRGARHLLLVGRSEPSAQARAVIEELNGQGVSVTVARGDVADRAQLEQLLREARTRTPLRGVVHAAGVLDDAMLLQLDRERFERVLAPKVAGAWNLHELTREDRLDLFVCFSSMASLFGSPGQGNYAAANAFLDALAHHRRTLGLPATSINWGAWAEAGMGAELDLATRQRQQARGLHPLATATALRCLDAILEQDHTQTGVLHIDWATFLNTLPQIPAFLQTFRKTRALDEAGQPTLRATLLDLEPEERLGCLAGYLKSQLASVLLLDDPDQISDEQGFFDLGLDSLMAVEMKNRLQIELRTDLPASMIFDHPNVGSLSGYLLTSLRLAPAIAEETGDASSAVLDDVRDLSDDEADALLEALAN